MRLPRSLQPARQRLASHALIVLWGLLLIGELMWLSLRFDALDLTRDRVGVLAVILRSAGLILKGLLVFVGATILAAQVRPARESAGSNSTAAEPAELILPRLGLMGRLLIQLAAFALLALLTSRVYTGSIAADAPRQYVTVAAWIGSFALTVAAWLALLNPARLRRILSGQLAIPALTGALVTVLALSLSYSTALLWAPFHQASFRLSSALLALFVPVVKSDPARFVLGTPGFQVAISRQCSGYEGIGLILAYLGAYLVLFRRSLRFPRALLLIPIGVVTIWLANTVRIVALILIGAAGWPDVAVGGFHSNAGWVFFLAIAFGLALAAQRYASLTSPAQELVNQTRNPTAAYLMPFLAILATGMLTGLVSAGGGSSWYAPRVVAALVLLGLYRREYPVATLRSAVTPASILAGFTVFGLWIALDRVFPGPSLSPPAGPISLLWLGFRILGTVVTVPIAEELAFRGFLMRRLHAGAFWTIEPRQVGWGAVLASSLAFGILHERWVAGIVAGAIYAVVYRRRGQLGEAILAHALTNALLVAWTLLTGDWRFLA